MTNLFGSLSAFLVRKLNRINGVGWLAIELLPNLAEVERRTSGFGKGRRLYRYLLLECSERLPMLLI